MYIIITYFFYTIVFKIVAYKNKQKITEHKKMAFIKTILFHSNENQKQYNIKKQCIYKGSKVVQFMVMFKIGVNT